MSTYAEMSKTFGGAMQFEIKLLGYINSCNCYRIKDYLLSYLDSNNPLDFAEGYKEHVRRMNTDKEDCENLVYRALDMLKEHGWKCKISKDDKQIWLCDSDTDSWYRSHYNYEQK